MIKLDNMNASLIKKLAKDNSHYKKESSLDNNTINCVTQNNTISVLPTDRVRWNNRYSATISRKSSQSYDIRRAIANYLSQGVVDQYTGEWLQYDLRDLDKKEARGIFSETYFENLCNYYYRLGLNDSLYAQFDNGIGLRKNQIIATKYSMHGLCPVWGFRRSQIIRKRYKEYFAANPELLANYHPCHMVLTLRHNAEGFYLKDEFIAQRFFARELIKEFKIFRDNHRHLWKQYIFGGCYNIEVKRSRKDQYGNDNGIHVHMHLLVLQNKSYKVNFVRDWIKRTWKLQTGATQTHYETLYYFDPSQIHEEDDFSEVQEVYDNETGTYEFVSGTKEVIPKEYYDDSWSIDQTSRAIMEALKYNFKTDAIQDENGDYDIAFITEILYNSKRLRFTSRFNAFYRVKELNFAELSEEVAELKDTNDHILAAYVMAKADEYKMTIDEISIEAFYYPHLDFRALLVNGYNMDYEFFLQRLPEVIDIVKTQRAKSIIEHVDVEKHYQNIVNPHTFEEASHEDFKIVLGFPHTIRHRPKDHNDANEPRYNPQNFYQVSEISSIKELTKSLMVGHYNQILAFDDLGRFQEAEVHLTQLRSV